MKIKHKLLLLIGGFALLIVGVLSVNFFLNTKSSQLYVAQQRENLAVSAHNAVSINGESLYSTVYDYSYWDNLYNFINEQDTAFSNAYLSTLTDYAHIDYAWVYNRKGLPIFYSQKPGKDTINLPADKADLYQLLDTLENSENRFADFYIKNGDSLYIVYAGTVHRTSDVNRLEKPQGAFLVAKTVDSLFLSKLGIITNSTVSVRFDSNQTDSNNKYSISSSFPIFNSHGELAGIYHFEKKDDFIKKNDNKQLEIMLYVAFIIFVLLIVLIFVFNNVLNRPFAALIRALDTGKSDRILKYKKSKSEFGKLALLIIEFFNQKNALESEIEERTQISLKLAEQNIELNSRNEEIQALNDNVTSANEELRQNNEEMMSLNEDISKKAAEIERNNRVIATINKEMIESMNYAAGLQRSVLPSGAQIAEMPFNPFVFFRPKDIVSGDFYYLKIREDNFIFAAADCTGHSVPGAIMSMLANSLLNEIMYYTPEASPAEILNRLRRLIKSSLKQTGRESLHKDGLDIAFCRLNINTLQLDYAGAYQPLWIFREIDSISEPEFIEISANRQPIGIYHKETPFTDHSIQLKKSDKVYIFSDGFDSQIGGQNNLKFKKKNFIQTLKEIRNLTNDKKLHLLNTKLETWMGTNAQTDDILLIGLSI